MIAIDTNVLVRLIVRDDDEQHQKVRALLSRVAAEGHTVFVPDVVLAELVWVLDRAYGFDDPTVLKVLRDLENSTEVVFRASDEISRAIDAYEAGNAGFADYLIAESARGAGASLMYTFD